MMCIIYLQRFFKKSNDASNLEKKKTFNQIIKKQFKDNILLIITVISVIIGIGLGFVLRIYTNLSVNEKAYFGFPGEVFY
jgi:hypothetical protein